MRGLGAMIWRELAERRLFAAGGLVLGLLPLAAPLVPGLAAGRPAGELREAAAVGLFWLASVVFSVLLGAAMFGGDLAARRLGFYFSRPLAGWAIWLGKLLPAVLLSLTSSALVLMPMLVAGRRLPPYAFLSSELDGGIGLEPSAGRWLLLVVLLVLGSHYVRSFVLAASPWGLLDLAGLVTAILAWRWIATRLVDAWALEALQLVTALLALFLVAALFFALGVQLLRGRTTVRGGHRLAALALWSVMTVALVLGVGFTAWVRAAAPGDLDAVDQVESAPAGDWISLAGTSRGAARYRPAFLYRLTDGAFLRLPAAASWFPVVFGGPPQLFSADGATACWLAPEERPYGPTAALVCADLAAARPRPRPTSIVLPSTARLALSQDGALLGQLAEGWLTVIDLRHERPVAHARFSGNRGSELFFGLEDDTLFVVDHRQRSGYVEAIWRLPPAARRLERLVQLDRVAAWSRDPTRDRLLLLREERDGAPEPWLVDLATGELSRVATPPGEGGWVAQILADGRLLLQSAGGAVGLGAADGETDAGLWLVGGDGRISIRIQQPAGDLTVGGQPASNRLVLAASAEPRGAEAWTTYLVDLETGAHRALGSGTRPVAGPTIGPRALGSRLLYSAGGELLLLDPEALELTPVVGGR